MGRREWCAKNIEKEPKKDRYREQSETETETQRGRDRERCAYLCVTFLHATPAHLLECAMRAHAHVFVVAILFACVSVCLSASPPVHMPKLGSRMTTSKFRNAPKRAAAATPEEWGGRVGEVRRSSSL